MTQVAWVPQLGLSYHLAADGISLTLLLLTGIAATAGILFSWNIEHRTQEFFAFYLVLIGGVYGVFLSFDLFLLFVFYEIAIIPKYFLIAIWGSKTHAEHGRESGCAARVRGDEAGAVFLCRERAGAGGDGGGVGAGAESQPEL